MAPQPRKCSELSVFKGRQARLNHAIFQVLGAEEPQAVWDIFKNATKLRGLKRKRYAVVEVRVKALESQGFLEKAGEREKKQGGKTPLFRLTAKARLALAIGSRSIDDILNMLSEEAAAKMLKIISQPTDAACSNN